MLRGEAHHSRQRARLCRSGRDRVDPDAHWSQLQRPTAGQVFERRLARGIVGQWSPWLVAERTRNIDDSSARALQMRESGRGEKTGADDIHREDFRDALGCRLGQRQDRTGTSVVDQCIQSPPTVKRFCDGASGVGRRCGVGYHADDIGMLGRRRFDRRRTPAGDDNLVALCREPQSCRPADAGAAASDDNDSLIMHFRFPFAYMRDLGFFACDPGSARYRESPTFTIIIAGAAITKNNAIAMKAVSKAITVD